MDIQIINLCPHEINIKDANGKLWYLPLSEKPARVLTDFCAAFYLGTIGVFQEVFRENINLPPVTENTMYIVSRQVVTYNPARKDLLYPGATYSENGVTFCAGLKTSSLRRD